MPQDGLCLLKIPLPLKALVKGGDTNVPFPAPTLARFLIPQQASNTFLAG
jgi:hypothetical protein